MALIRDRHIDQWNEQSPEIYLYKYSQQVKGAEAMQKREKKKRAFESGVGKIGYPF